MKLHRCAALVSSVALPADATELISRLLGRAVWDAGKEIQKSADKSARIMVYYSEEGGDRVAHFFQRSF
jgi:hypothetical protein